MKIKKVMGFIMLLILLVSLISIFSLNSKRNDQEFLGRINDRELRVEHIAWIEKHYVPLQIFSIGGVVFIIYTLLQFINSDYIDGKTYKILIYFLINALALVRSVFINQRLYHAGKMAANGELPSLSYLGLPLITVSLLYIGGQLLERSIENDYYREFDENKDSEYATSWKKLEETLKR